MRGPEYEPLTTSNDAEEYVAQSQARSVSLRPAIYYGEGPFSPPSSDDEDDYAKEGDNNANSIMGYELRNGDDEEELVVGRFRRPVRSRFLSNENATSLVPYSDSGLLNIF
jgi:hypothetical protein